MAAGFGEIDDVPMKHLFDRVSGAGLASSGGVVRLAAGAPGPDLLRRCLPLFGEATQHRLEREAGEANIMQYGAAPGSWEFRDELAKFLSEHYRDPVNRADLVLTCGATHGLQVALASLLAPGAVIFVEDATYMIALDVFKEFPALPLVPVRMDEGGLVVADLQTKAEERRAAGSWSVCEEKPFWAMLYCMPVFHNPTGVTMSQDRCAALVSLARRLQLLVFCDDVYNLLAHGSEPPRRLFAQDRPGAEQHGGHVVSNGTFSKMLAPGVRVGWLETPPRVAAKLRQSGLIRSSGAVNQYMSGVVTSLLQLGLQRNHLRFLSNTLEDRMTAVCRMLDSHLPPTCHYRPPGGGYYVWLELPRGSDAEAFNAWSQKHHGVSALSGGQFCARPGVHDHCLRIAVAFHERAVLEDAVLRLCGALHAFLALPAVS